MSRILRWGILGTSPISSTMAKHLSAATHARLVAVASRDKAKAEAFANAHDIPHYYDSYDALLSAEDIDAVYIGLPNHLHYDWIVHAAHAGKHMICEKPLILNRREAQVIREVLAGAKVYCLEGLMYRCHPFLTRLREIVASGVLGELRFFQAFYAADIAKLANPQAGGAIRNLGCYPLSLLQWLTRQADITALTASGRLSNQQDADREASLHLQFTNQLSASITVADDLPKYHQCAIYGTKGKLEIHTNVWMPQEIGNHATLTKDNEIIPIVINADKPLYSYQFDFLSELVLTKETIPSGFTLEDSLQLTGWLEDWRAELFAKESIREVA